jgi:hypothetical protein
MVTSVEQSKKLLELGVDKNTADMWWNYYSVSNFNNTAMIVRLEEPWVGSFNWNNLPDNIPCWSISALLNIIRGELDEKRCRYCEYTIDCDGGDIILIVTSSMLPNALKFKGKSLVDLCVEAICKLYEYKPIFKDIK